jgi:hypothetical protein
MRLRRAPGRRLLGARPVNARTAREASVPGRVRAIAGVGLAAGVASCILFVSPPEGGSRCTFQGEETACGACLVASCQDAINAACFDDSILSPMEECASDGDQACELIPASEVATCLANKCGALCYEMIGQSETHCTDSAEAPGAACSCRFETPTTTLDCSTATYPGTKCCAPAGWPAPGLECTCNPIACSPRSTGDGCGCTLTTGVRAAAARTCSGINCCALGNSCVCSSAPCEGLDTRQVCDCDVGAVGCPPGTMALPSCSVRD